MAVTMTAKNQITIPKKITNVLGLGKGAMFNVEISKKGIELIPLNLFRAGKPIIISADRPPGEIFEKGNALGRKIL